MTVLSKLVLVMQCAHWELFSSSEGYVYESAKIEKNNCDKRAHVPFQEKIWYVKIITKFWISEEIARMFFDPTSDESNWSILCANAHSSTVTVKNMLRAKKQFRKRTFKLQVCKLRSASRISCKYSSEKTMMKIYNPNLKTIWLLYSGDYLLKNGLPKRGWVSRKANLNN